MERVTGWSQGTSPIEVLRAGKGFVARRAEHVGARRRAGFAGAFAARVIARYWKAIQVGCETRWPLPSTLGAGVEHVDLDDETDWLAGTIGQAAADVDPVTAGYFIGTTYAAALPADVRSRFGVYYTPPALAGRLIDLLHLRAALVPPLTARAVKDTINRYLEDTTISQRALRPSR